MSKLMYICAGINVANAIQLAIEGHGFTGLFLAACGVFCYYMGNINHDRQKA